MCKMYRGENIVLMIETKVAKELGDEKMERLKEIVALFRRWADKTRLDRDARIKLLYRETNKDDEDDAGVKMEVDSNNAQYNYWEVTITDVALVDPIYEYREYYVVHELNHIVLYPYTRVASGISKKFEGMLNDHEETVVTKLTLIMLRLEYDDDIRLPIDFSD